MSLIVLPYDELQVGLDDLNRKIYNLYKFDFITQRDLLDFECILENLENYKFLENEKLLECFENLIDLVASLDLDEQDEDDLFTIIMRLASTVVTEKNF